jgi:hypothetical protein
VWLAKLAGWGMLRASFVPPAEIRALRANDCMRVAVGLGPGSPVQPTAAEPSLRGPEARVALFNIQTHGREY